MRDTYFTMKRLIRALVLLLAATLFLLPPSVHVQLHAQDAAQEPDGGMSPSQVMEHTVRGIITAISGSTITLKTEEGEVYAVATGPNTRFRKPPDPAKISDLHTGDMIMAFGDKDAKAKTVGAMFVVIIDKQQEEKMRADFGKTWTTGVVQSIDGTNIVIKRPDNVTQTIAVDENTSFRHRRDDITLPDIKAGDNVTARGALQNGVFLATLINMRHSDEGGRWVQGRQGPVPAPAAADTTHQNR